MDMVHLMSEDEDFVEVIRILSVSRQPKIIRNRPNHFEIWRDHEFFDRFRLSKTTVRLLLEEIKDNIASPTTRNAAVTAESMLLISLRYFATGSFVSVCGDFGGIHKSTCSRIIRKVSRAIADLRRKYICFPQSRMEMDEVRNRFYNISKFPRCIGAIDCTHVKIKSPGGDNAEIYRNRKGFFSFNVQTICDADLKIRNIVVRWPGSTHDSTIFNNSKIRASFERGLFHNNVLVGDSGYALRQFLITKLAKPTSHAENLFNESLLRTRNCVERCYGVWKRRFPVLARGINLHISNVEAVIVATAVIHNIACDMRDREPETCQELNEMINATNFNQGLANNVPRNNARHPFVLYFQDLADMNR